MAKEITLALGGGGIRGLAHIGVIRCLVDHGYKIAGIAGTSAGGLFGALYAAGLSLDAIEDLAAAFAAKPGFNRKQGDESSLLGVSGVEKLLNQVLGDISFDSLKIPFVATAVDLDGEKEIILDKGRVVDAVLATIAMPGILPPRKLDDMFLVDGGVLDPVPVSLARQLNPRLPVVAVRLYKKKTSEAKEQAELPFLSLFPDILAKRLVRQRLVEAFRVFYQGMELINVRMAEANLEIDKPDVIVSPMVGHYHTLDLKIPKDMIARGYTAMENELAHLQESEDLVNSLRRIRLYVTADDNLHPTIPPLATPENGDQSKK